MGEGVSGRGTSLWLHMVARRVLVGGRGHRKRQIIKVMYALLRNLDFILKIMENH